MRLHIDYYDGRFLIKKKTIKQFVENHEQCAPGKDVTHIEMNWYTSEATLVYDDSAFVNTMCCYHEIVRTGRGRNADTEFG